MVNAEGVIFLQKCDDDSETSNWIAANTKECPKCNVTIEKDGGCNHMVCKNQNCKADFCWVCLGPWEPHGSSWYNCNRYVLRYTIIICIFYVHYIWLASYLLSIVRRIFRTIIYVYFNYETTFHNINEKSSLIYVRQFIFGFRVDMSTISCIIFWGVVRDGFMNYLPLYCEPDPICQAWGIWQSPSQLVFRGVNINMLEIASPGPFATGLSD